MLTLPAVLDLTVATSLKTDLQAAIAGGEGLEIDCSQVQRVTSPCLQILIAAKRGFEEAGGPAMNLANVPPAFTDVLNVLALTSLTDGSGALHA